MWANTTNSSANGRENIDDCQISEPFFRLEGNKSAHLNSPSVYNQEQVAIRLLDRLAMANDSDMFVLFSSALCVLLFKYTHNENVFVDVEKENMDKGPMISWARFNINARLKSSMTLKEVVDQISENIRNEGEKAFLGKELIKESRPSLRKTNMLFVYGSSENLSDELKNYDFCIQINLKHHELKKSATITVFYSPEVFENWYISNMIRHYKRIIYRFVIPTIQIRNLKMMSAAEHRNIIEDFNRTDVTYPSEKTVHEQFEDQVRLNPDKTAVLAGGRSLSYAQLNEASNQLAHWLKEKYEIKPDDVIGLLLGRSERMICGMLAVLKSGGAFLPVDPGYPINRIKYILNDAGVKVLVSESQYIDLIRDYLGPVFLISEVSKLPFIAKDNLPIPNTSDDLAYVMYTSGSTGNPKGVSIEHRGLFNTQFWRKRFYGFDETYMTLQIASFSFDSSINDIFSMLMWGGTLLIADENERLEIKRLNKLIGSQSVTNFNVVPSFYSLLLDEIDTKSNGLRVVTLAGEKLTKEIIRRHFKRFPDVPIVNEYGPTENSICTTATILNGGRSRDAHIGMPIDNTKVYILGEDMEIVPPGVSGEICISGVGLARGYLNNPELTGEKFVANPFIPGQKMYRTGDLGRWTADGNIEFLGRIDDQVKVRGIRVELGEIETALAQHPVVQENVVINQEDHAGMARLVAYVVTNQRQTLQVDDLRRFLKEKLPDYMVPSAFVIIDALPLAPSGKVDRRALPALEQVSREPDSTFVPPRDELEYQITEIWEKVLGIKHIGVRDDFFKLGGSSLLGMVMFDQIEKLTGKYFPPATLLYASTIEQIVGLIRKGREGGTTSPSSITAIHTTGSKPPIFLIHGADGNIILYRDLARRLGPDQPVYGLQPKNLDTQQPVFTTVEDMASQYLREIIAFQPQDPYFLGGYCLGGSIAYEIAQQLIARGKTVALLVLMETYNYSKAKHPSLVDNVYYYMQRVEFHFRNFLLLNSKEKLAFIKGKIIAVKRRRNVWLGMLSMKLSRKVVFRNKQASNLYQLWKVNDKAASVYKPKAYPGRMVQFITIKEYARYRSAEVGWDKLSTGELEVQRLPLYPAGMLVEPFVQILAKKIRTRLEEAQRTI
jgi:amino acid adenylation domain-containing protein